MIVKFLDVVLFSTYFLLLFFAIFWLLVLFFPENEQKKKKLIGTPFFTIIVPAYNEEKSIVETLTSIVHLDYPKEKMEVIVVNDGSTDTTKKLVEEFITCNPGDDIILLNQENQGKGKALNVGLDIARGEYYACLDADSFISPNAINEMLPYFQADTNVAAVCPLLKVRKPNSVLQKVQWTEYLVNMFYKLLNSKIDCIHVTPGPFSIYRTKIIKDLGGYDEKTITEDLEIAIRLQKHHYRIVQTFDAIVETVAPNSLRDLFRQRVRWYKGSVDNTISYRKIMFNKEYGDFGFLRMPTIILSGIIAIIVAATLLRELFIKSFQWFGALKAINFDIITLIKNFSFDFNVLSLPFFKIIIAATLFCLSFFIMIYSYRIIKEKIRNHGRTLVSMLSFLFLYGLFITFVWMYIAFIFVAHKKNRWT
ncbi:hypothetical protein COV17_02480 [Candidatus Woesearchaeota archaeon CG10_big_fil_rev_8_21_14_0_10_36_11]|nr:MAG: hypothetical protein COV17_02480 [Candidatus Woesearchaeota archaeon CG10_big_fil_rev_8_21_14_0_10_36_11]